MANKKAQEELKLSTVYIIFAIIIFAVLLIFVQSTAKGDTIKKQVLAKQIALLIDSAKQNTEITINKGNFIVSIEGSNIIVKSKQEEKGYSYDFFSKYSIQLEDQGENLIIYVK